MATAKDKTDAKPEDAPAADDAPAPAEELPPFHGLEPTWVADALRDILARLAKLEK